MNEIVNNYFLYFDFISRRQIHALNSCLKENPDLPRVLVDHLQETKEEHKNAKKQEIQGIFIKTN